MSRGRDWFITINNYSEEELQACRNVDCKLVVVGCEVGEQGTRHLHCFVQFKDALRFARVQKMFPRANIQQRRGTVDEAIAYVCKDDKNPFIRGEKSVQGQRTDLRELIDQNACLYDLMEADPVKYCMYRNGLRDIYARKEQVNAEEFCPDVWWLSGPTGCGKTRSAIEHFKDACVLHCCKDMWFDEYDGSDVVVFDEFRHDSIPYQTLLAMTTWNRGMKARVKGGFVWFHPRTIIFTSPERVESEFSYRAQDEQRTVRSDFEQLRRRILHEVWFDEHLKRWCILERSATGNNSVALFQFGCE